MLPKRIEQVIINQGQSYYNCDATHISTIIQEELEVAIDEVSEAQATGLINITGMSYEMGMVAGIDMGERMARRINRIVTFN
jgi:hypothetical protein